jgi:Tol biopolymer transport system component
MARELTRHTLQPASSGEVGDNNPRFMPDGRRIVFTRVVGHESAIYVIGVDGRGLRRLTRGSRHEDAGRVSPDGRYLAYGTNATGEPDPGEIFVENLRTGRATRLTRGSGRGKAGSFMGAWSRDGRYIVFASDRSGSWQIYVEPATAAPRRASRRTPSRPITPIGVLSAPPAINQSRGSAPAVKSFAKPRHVAAIWART